MTRRRAAVALSLPLLLVAPGACGGDDGQITAVGDPSGSGRSGLPDPADPAAPADPSDPTGEPSRQDPSATTTTVPYQSATPDQILLAAVAEFRQNLDVGLPIRALELTVWFPESGAPYASLQHQDPDAPANVDQRDWRDGRVSGPEPVRLTGDGDLEANLFSLDEIAWETVAAGLAGAPALVEAKLGRPIEDGRGVTHVIATKDLPFSPNTVVRVYVDGGARTTGGYVEYLADGTVGEVQA